tara:strand:- start:290 stop:526 length:237 start_codon:yes stop_codon:yes gene_type:complete
MKKLIYLLFVFTLISCSSGDDDVVETPSNLELTGGWVSQLNTNFYGGIDFGVSSNSTTPMYSLDMMMKRVLLLKVISQ